MLKQVSRAKSFAFLFKIPNILITKLVAFFSKLTKVKCKITLHAPQNHFFALTSKVKMVPIIFRVEKILASFPKNSIMSLIIKIAIGFSAEQILLVLPRKLELIFLTSL